MTIAAIPTTAFVQQGLDDLDQSQTYQNDKYYLSRWFAYGQSFKPDTQMLTKIELYLRHSGSSNNIILVVRDDLYGSDITSAIVDADDIAINQWLWVEFDVENCVITPGQTYYILVTHISGGDLDVVSWGCSNTNIYFDGTGYEMEISAGTWNMLNNVDFCFKTYGINNQAPNTPNPPSGPGNGNVGTWYEYCAYTTDPNGDDIYYKFDWGDGTDSDWLAPVPSGDTKCASHVWTETGTYPIRVKAKDIYGSESSWSAPLYVSMPKSKMQMHPIIQYFFEQHQGLYQLLQHILNLYP